MPKGKITWQMRGDHLARCFGCTASQLAAGIDAAMARNPQGTAGRPASTTGAAGNAVRAKKTRRRTRAKQTAEAAS